MPENAARQWIAALLQRHGLERPDQQRPLYAYRCSQVDFKDLGDITGAILQATAQKNPPNRLAVALFCLFAAEWVRRHYAGGKLRYRDILQTIAVPTPAPLVMQSWVRVGLRYWGRPLLQTPQTTIYLRTLACEGGLPLQLLQRETASLHHYFHVLLTQFSTYQNADINHEALAAQAAQQHLPKYLHQDIVYTLSAQIVATAQELRRKIAGAADPIPALDAAQPNWRERFPLELTDQTAQLFLNGLITAQVQTPTNTAFEVTRSLRRIDGGPNDCGWQLHGDIELPASMSVAEATQALGGESSGRLQLLLQIDEGSPTLLAWVTASGNRVRIERSRGISSTVGIQATRSFQFSTRPALQNPIDAIGSAALESLPWLFISTDDSQTELSFRGQGSLTTVRKTLWVALAPGWSIDVDANATVAPAGRLHEIDRTLFRVEGQARISSDDGSYCRIQTGAAQAEETAFRLHGQLMSAAHAPIPQYLGAPRIFEVGQDGIRMPPADQLQWRPLAGGGWQAFHAQCIGDGELRVIDPDGALRHRTRLGILPANLRVEYVPPLTSQGGGLRFTAALAAIGVPNPPPGLNWQQQAGGGDATTTIELLCDNEPPESITLELRWPIGATSKLTLPFPASGARFIDSTGQVLPPNALVIRDRLSGVRVRVISPHHAAHCWLSAQLLAGGLDHHLARAVRLEHPIPPVPGTNERVRELNLLELRDDLQTMLAASPLLDATVRLRIESLAADQAAMIQIGRYDSRLVLIEEDQPDAELAVRLNQQALAQIGQEDLQRMRLSMFPLWMPETTALELRPRTTEGVLTGEWVIDQQGLDAGPWMITATEGDWTRTRPLIVQVNADKPPPQEVEATAVSDDATPSLATAIRMQDAIERALAIERVVEGLIANGASPDWELVLELVKVFADLPASTLDLFPCMAKHPEAVVMALLREDVAEIGDLLALFEQLPFSWRMVPIKAWLSAIRRHRNSLNEALQELPDPQQLIWRSIESVLRAMEVRYPFVQLVRELAYREVYSHFPIGQGVLLNMAARQTGLQIFEEKLIQAHQALIHGKDRWPQGPALMDWFNGQHQHYPEAAQLEPPTPPGCGYRRPVQLAPIVAAMTCAYGLNPPARVVYEIASLRTFDEQWFDDAYRWALVWILGWLLQQNPAHWEQEQ